MLLVPYIVHATGSELVAGGGLAGVIPGLSAGVCLGVLLGTPYTVPANGTADTVLTGCFGGWLVL